jgi:DivIVA domain-containing protein
MGILNDLGGWAFIVVAAATAPGSLRELVRARRTHVRFRAIQARVWTGLWLSLVCLSTGINALLETDNTWLRWILLPIGIALLMSLAVPGIVSRRRASVAWWRFWVRVIPPPSAAKSACLGDHGYLPPGPADTLDPGPAIVLDASTVGLIERINNARFGTTRFSAGYDEEEVDVFLDKLIAVLSEAGQPDQEELGSVRFTRTWLRPGYVLQDVDSLLQEIAQAALRTSPE